MIDLYACVQEGADVPVVGHGSGLFQSPKWLLTHGIRHKRHSPKWAQVVKTPLC